MTKTGIFKSNAGEKIIGDWYQRYLSRLSYPIKQLKVMTSLGQTSVIRAGTDKGIPIVGLHGALAGAPHMMGELGKLPHKFRFYGIDIVGQSVASAQIRPNVKSNAFANWLEEVLDELQLDQVILMAVSWGGCVAMNAAVHCPDRIKGMILLSPGSIVSGNILTGLSKISFPVMMYKLFPSEKRRDWALQHLLSEPGEYWSPFIAHAMQHIITDFSLPPLIKKEQLKNFQAPVYVFGADEDIVFPGHKLLKRSKDIFPNLVGTHLFENCRHCPPFHEQFIQNWVSQLEQVLDTHFGVLPEQVALV